MPLLQGQPFRLIKPPEHVETEVYYTIQHTGEKFLSKSDYEDRLALYSQSIWTCQCSGKSGMTHQEAWTSESKVRVLLASSFPEPLWSPILHCIHHSTQPLDQLVETASALCISRFHPGEELTYLTPPQQVRVISAREASEIENGEGSIEKPKASEDAPASPPATPLTNGCATASSRDSSSVNGTSNGSAGSDDSSPQGSAKPKEDSNRKKELLPLLYDVVVIGEDRKIKDVSAKDLQRTYKIPPKEHFRLFIRANALRQRASAFTPWIVSEELVNKYNIPGKLASVFTQPSFSFTKKRKLEQSNEKSKKQKGEKVGETHKNDQPDADKDKKEKEPTDPNIQKKKPGPKPGTKRTPKVESEETKPTPVPVKAEAPTKMETSDSDDDISLAALANKSPKFEDNSSEATKSPEKVTFAEPVKREAEKDTQSHKKMKQATLFDMKPSSKSSKPATPSSPKKSPQKKVATPESVMRMPIMRRLLHQRKLYKGVRGMGRKIVYTIDQVLSRLSLKQIAVIPDLELQKEIMSRREKVLEKRILATMSADDREAYLKQKALEDKRKKKESRQVLTMKIQEQNKKLEDRIIPNHKPLPPPRLVPTPEEIPNSVFGDIAMIIEFIECYREVVITDKKSSISCQHLMQALAAGKEGFKFISEIMVLLLHIIIDDERIGDHKELGVKISELAVHYQTAIELARLCLTRGSASDSASQHSDDNDFEEECELSEGLLKKLDNHELYELQAVEIIEVLRALCHRAMASYTSLEYYEDIEEKTAVLHKQYLQIKKENNKQELQKKKEKREELIKKKKEKNLSPKKNPGRPKKQGNTLEGFIKVSAQEGTDKEGEPENVNEEEDDENCPDIISVVKRKRLTAEQLQKEKEELSKEMKEKRMKEEEEKMKAMVVTQWEKTNRQRDLLMRLHPLGVDRNHDRYWLFNDTTPGLYIEKGWVDANTTYCVKSPSPKKGGGSTPIEKEKSLKAASKSLTFTTPVKSSAATPVVSKMSVVSSTVSATESVVSTSVTLVNSTTVVTNSLTLVSSTTTVVSTTVTAVDGSCLQLPNSVSEKVSPVSQSGTSGSSSSAGSLATAAVSSAVIPANASLPVKSDSLGTATVSSKETSAKVSLPVKSDSLGTATVSNAETSAKVSLPVKSDCLATVSSTVTPANVSALVMPSSVSESSTTTVALGKAISSSESSPHSNGAAAPKANASVVSDSITNGHSATTVTVTNSATTETNKTTAPKPEVATVSSLSQQVPMSSQKNSESQKIIPQKLRPDADSDSDEKPLATVKKQLDLEAEEKPLSVIKKELADSPAKAKGRPRGRPPKPKVPGEVKTPPRPRGRPPKERTPGEVKVPRPRGRPPKPKTPLKNADGTPLKEGESPAKTPGRPRGRPKMSRALNEDETFPPVGQNMWFFYTSLEEVDKLIESLAPKGVRESKLKSALTHARQQMEINFVKEWQPLDDFVDGSVQLLETLREDIIQIERELTEGWLGSVPEPEEWEKKANEARTVQELGECLIEAQRHMQFKFLKGIMKPTRKLIPSDNPELPQEYEEIEGVAVQQWRDAVSSCATLSRLHLLVGMFDSCIKWEKSMATKKCKVCRTQDTSIPIAICDKCEGSYHWRCMRPPLCEEPAEPWLCPACLPSKNKERRKITRDEVEEEKEEPQTQTVECKQEKICRVCERGIGLIFCSNCPAAYHSECHNPPLQTRARKDWKCVDCQKRPRNRSSRAAAAKAKQEVKKKKEPPKKEKKSKSSKENKGKRSTAKKVRYVEVEEDDDDDDDEEEEEEEEEDDEEEEEDEEDEVESSENDDSDDEDFSTRRKSKRVRKTVHPPRRTTSRSIKKKSYKIESEEEEEEEEDVEEEEDEQEQESDEEEDQQEEEEEVDNDEEEDNEEDDEKEDAGDGDEDEEEEEENENAEEEDEEENEPRNDDDEEEEEEDDDDDEEEDDDDDDDEDSDEGS